MAAFDNLSNPSEYLAYWGKTYRNELLSNILPFWMKYGLDKENGGYFTCVDRDGTLMDSTKSVWFQGPLRILRDFRGDRYGSLCIGIRRQRLC